MDSAIFSENFSWTEDQKEVLKSKTNTLIKGVAGSGKTILAIKKAVDLSEQGFAVAFIVFTKALKTFISDKLNYEIFDTAIFIVYEYEWKKNKKLFDYIVVDEFQDFSLLTLTEIESCATKGFFCFGDLEQQLYKVNFNKEKTISESELTKLNFDKIFFLKENFRIPKSIVEIINQFQNGINNSKSLNQNLSNYTKPIIKPFDNNEEELKFISETINTYSRELSIGILLIRNNDLKIDHTGFGEFDDKIIEPTPSILELHKYLSSKTDIQIGYKHKKENHLQFQGKTSVNIMTIHSSKGIEFDIVILPFCRLSNTFFHINQFYVATTRCKNKLIITYNGIMPIGFSKINRGYYEGFVKYNSELEEILNE